MRNQSLLETAIYYGQVDKQLKRGSKKKKRERIKPSRKKGQELRVAEASKIL